MNGALERIAEALVHDHSDLSVLDHVEQLMDEDRDLAGRLDRSAATQRALAERSNRGRTDLAPDAVSGSPGELPHPRRSPLCPGDSSYRHVSLLARVSIWSRVLWVASPPEALPDPSFSTPLSCASSRRVPRRTHPRDGLWCARSVRKRRRTSPVMRGSSPVTGPRLWDGSGTPAPRAARSPGRQASDDRRRSPVRSGWGFRRRWLGSLT